MKGALSLTFAVALLVVAIAVVWFSNRARSKGINVADSYRAKKPVSEPEQTLYWRLREAMPECIVLCQVSLSRFLEADTREAKAYWALLNRIAQKSVDFLICLPDFTIVAAIELDDGTHRREVERY